MSNAATSAPWLIPGSEGRPEPEFKRISEPGDKKTVHTDLFHRCQKKVAGEKGDKSAYAICTASIGRKRSFLKFGQVTKGKSKK